MSWYTPLDIVSQLGSSLQPVTGGGTEMLPKNSYKDWVTVGWRYWGEGQCNATDVHDHYLTYLSMSSQWHVSAASGCGRTTWYQ